MSDMNALKLRLLFVDDSDIDVELTLRALKQRGYELAWERVEREDDMRRALAAGAPDAIISDFSMPLFDGVQALRVAREVLPSIPFVFLSGTIGGERATQAMSMGATGYVEKGDTEKLDRVLRRIAAR